MPKRDEPDDLLPPVAAWTGKITAQVATGMMPRRKLWARDYLEKQALALGYTQTEVDDMPTYTLNKRISKGRKE